jgi:hypothetical protein
LGFVIIEQCTITGGVSGFQSAYKVADSHTCKKANEKSHDVSGHGAIVAVGTDNSA